MWSIISSLFSEPIKSWQDRKTLKVEQQFELKKLAHQTKVAKATALLELAKKGQQQDYDLDRIAMENMQKSWTDELVLLIFLTPMVLAFFPAMQQHILNGFKTIEKMPHWYVAIIIGMVVVIYGMRGLLKAYLTRNTQVLPTKTSDIKQTKKGIL